MTSEIHQHLQPPAMDRRMLQEIFKVVAPRDLEGSTLFPGGADGRDLFPPHSSSFCSSFAVFMHRPIHGESCVIDAEDFLGIAPPTLWVRIQKLL